MAVPEAIVFTVQSEEEGQRLDLLTARRLETVSRSTLRRWIDAGHVTVQERARKANYQVKPGDRIRIVPPPVEPTDLVAEPLPLEIIHEDPVLVVVNKPAGMVVHPAKGNPRGTLANALLFHFQAVSRGDTIRPGIVHRLDKATSGVLVVAKNDRAHDALAQQFKQRRVEKRYVALVHGCLKEGEGVVNVGLGRDPFSRKKISTRSRRPRESITRYQVVRRYRYFTLLHVFPHTGRTHQIRVHFEHLGHPVVGDATYGSRPNRRVKDGGLLKDIQHLGRHFLHAESLVFTHPESGKRVSFQAPLPEELAHFLQALE